MKRILVFFILILLFLGGCDKEGEKRNVDFFLCREEETPDEVRSLIEEKKEEPFCFTYQNSAALYLAVGYGQQRNGEYVVAVRDLYEMEQGIYLDTVLITLSYAEEQAVGDASSCPYAVIRCPRSDKTVFFR